MNYEQALQQVNKRLRFGIKPGLERMAALMKKLDDPQEKLKFVHVAGTNGKGTVCTLIASVLRESGLVTGLNTSPYVLDFRERFQIDGEMISKEELTAEIEQVAAAADALEAEGQTVTEFEFVTAIALHWFAARRCDVAVLEVGLGGLLDATNVIPVPEAAVIMSVSLDHTAVLGDTLTQIATEKAGIIKPGGRVVVYPEQDDETWAVVRSTCREKGAELYIPCMNKVQTLEASIAGTEFALDGLKLRTPFLGEHQVKNAATALLALEILEQRGFPVTEATIRQGFAKAFIPARMEILSRAPLCLLDGGHNPGCAAVLRDALLRFVPGRRIAVMGIMADKDSREYLRLVGPLFQRVITVTPGVSRSLPAEELAALAAEYCEATPAETMEEAARLALEAVEDGSLVVCGSFYLAAEIRPILQKLLG